MCGKKLSFASFHCIHSYPTLSTPGVEATQQHHFLLHSRGPQAFSTQAQNLCTFSEIIEYILGQTLLRCIIPTHMQLLSSISRLRPKSIRGKKREEIESWRLPLHTLLSFTQPSGEEVTPQLPGMVGFLFTSI